jgi:hypothetical protein
MIRFFRTTQPAALLILLIFSFICWIRVCLTTVPAMDESDLPLWSLIASVFSHFPSWLNFIFLFVIVIGEIFYLNSMLNRHEVLYKNSFLPAFIFTLLICSTPLMMKFHPVYIINLIVISILDRIFYLYKSESVLTNLFDCGFLAGLAALMYFPGFVLLPMLLTTLWVLRPIRLKEWLIIIISFLLPFFFFSVYLFWNHWLVDFWSLYIDHFKNINLQLDIPRKTSLIIFSSLVFFLFLFSSVKLILNYRKNTIRTRSYQQIFFVYFVFSFAWLIFSKRLLIVQFSFMIIPMVIFCSYYFLSAKRKLWLYETFLLVLIGLVVWNHLG